MKGEDDMKCKICDFEGKSLVSHITRKHNMSIEDYKEKYNINKVHSISKKHKNKLSKLWKERLKEPYWSKKLNKNKISQFQIKYWTDKGFSEDEAKTKISEIQSKNSKKRDYIKSPSVLTIDYWLNEGFSEEEAEIKIRNIQSDLSSYSSKFSGKTHSKKSKVKIGSSMKKYIKSYGKAEWLSHFGEYTEPKFRSSSEIEIFEFIQNNISKDVEANVFIGDYNLDIVLGKKVIEFFGVYWHCHKDLFEDDDIHPQIQKKAKEIRKYDDNKIKFLEKNEYDVMVIWEHTYNKNKEFIFENIRRFINNGS